MRVTLCAAILCALAVGAGGKVPPVPCDDVIDTTRFPFRGSGYRTVLSTFAVPPAYMREIEDTGRGPWRYWRKAGLVIRAGSEETTVSVARASRKRVAIGWGNRDGAYSTLRFSACPGAAAKGLAYAGGFKLRVPAACVPLVFTAGDRSATVRFGLGRRCG
jgi:hypothetical protein